jgi:hypothetical protein
LIKKWIARKHAKGSKASNAACDGCFPTRGIQKQPLSSKLLIWWVEGWLTWPLPEAVDRSSAVDHATKRIDRWVVIEENYKGWYTLLLRTRVTSLSHDCVLNSQKCLVQEGKSKGHRRQTASDSRCWTFLFKSVFIRDRVLPAQQGMAQQMGQREAASTSRLTAAEGLLRNHLVAIYTAPFGSILRYFFPLPTHPLTLLSTFHFPSFPRPAGKWDYRPYLPLYLSFTISIKPTHSPLISL